MSSKIKVDAVQSNSASTAAITLDGSGTAVYKATSVETPNIKHASSSSNNIVLASDGSVKTNQVAHTANGASIFTLPQTDGSANHVLKTNGSGALSFGAPSNGNSLQVLEQFLSPCDASVIPLSQGNVTLADVTDGQQMETSYADITGSEISYTPPTGTTQVIYEFQLHCASHDNHGIGHIRLYLDGTWVSDASMSWGASNHFDSRICYRWGFNIGGTANTATGRVASWSSAKAIKLMGREYGSGNESKVHFTQYWDGTGTDRFIRPCIGITAIGVPS